MYYLWFNEIQSGPYTLHQVQSMWSAGQITAETPFWQDGAAEWLPLSEILTIIEPKETAALIAKTSVIPHLQGSGRQPLVRNNFSGKAAEPAAGPATEQDVWTGNPTWWKWIWLLGVGVALTLLPIALFVFLPSQSFILYLAPLVIAVIIFVSVYLNRSSTRYTVTNKRIGVQTGIFTKNSRELRIQDIRSIAAKTNMLGYGDIEFSSAASDDAEVTFVAVSSANAVRDMVKKLQI